VLLFGLMLVASVARAEDAEAIILKGLQLRTEGRDREALAEFQRAAALKETPRGTAQIGLAEQALGLWVDAEDHLKHAVEQDGDPWIQKNRRVLEDALSEVKSHLGTVEIWGTPEGAEVLLGGKPIGKLPNARTRVPAADIQLLVRLGGYVDVSRVLQVPKRGHVREHVELVPLPTEPARPVAAAAEPAPPAHATAPPPASPPPAVEHTPPPPAPPEPASWHRPVKWAAFGLGLAAVAGGGAENVLAAVKANNFATSHCTKDSQGHIAGGSSCEQLDRDQANATKLAIIGYSVGGALLVTALVLHLTEPSSAPARTALAACTPTIGAAGITAGLGCRLIW